MWAGKPADAPKPMAIEQFVPFVSDYKFFDDMGVRVYDNGHSFSGVELLDPQQVLGDSRATTTRWRRPTASERARADPRHGAPQHRLLPEPDDQGRDPGDPRGAADRGRQDADRELDLPPEGRAADELLQRTVHVQPADQLAVLGGRPRRPARLPRRSRKACTRAATSGSACTATSIRPRSAQAEITTNGTSEISDAQPVPRLGDIT